nr:uncharacterized protein LOC129264149 [Lytechinus pictus]
MEGMETTARSHSGEINVMNVVDVILKINARHRQTVNTAHIDTQMPTYVQPNLRSANPVDEKDTFRDQCCARTTINTDGMTAATMTIAAVTMIAPPGDDSDNAVTQTSANVDCREECSSSMDSAESENLKSSNSPRSHAADQSSPQSTKPVTSPRQDSIMPTTHIISPSGKKRLSPTCTTNRSINNNMHTLNVDISLANAKVNSVSPGRQCLSDSRLTVKPSKNIPVSNHRKRKIDMDGAEITAVITVPMTSPKQKRLSPPDICNNVNINVQSKKDLTVDWNQNERNISDASYGKRRSSWSETSPDSYKHSHNIGHRKVSPRVSPKIPNSAELHPAIGWKAFPNSKMQNNHKDTHNADRHTNSVSPTSAKVQQNGRLKSSHASIGEQKRPSLSHSISNDSVFDENVSEPNEIDEERFEKVDSEVAFIRTPGVKNNAAGDMGKPKQATGRTSPRGGGKPKEVIRKNTLGSSDSGVDSKRKRKGSVSESVGSESVLSSCTEDSFTDDGSMAGREGLSSPEDGKPKKRRFKFADTLPPRAPRARREASLTAETKVHLLYERDDFVEKMPVKVSAPKKPKASQSVSDAQGGDLLTSRSISSDIKVAKDTCKVGSDSKGKRITEHTSVTNGQEKAKEPKKPAIKAKLKNDTPPTSSKSELATETSAQTCSRCGKPIKPQGNRTPDEASDRKSNDLKTETSPNNKISSPSSTTLLPTLKEPAVVPHSTATPNHLSCSCTQAQRSISEPAPDNALMKALAPLLGQPRRASIDAAECEKLNASLKGAFLLRLSRHSIDAPTTIANQLSLPLAQLGILQSGNLHASNGTPNNGTIVTVPQPNDGGTTVTEFINSKSKVIRKVVKRPGLKPFHRRKSTNGWRGEGNPVQKPVIINNESVQEVRFCYESIRRKDDVIKTRDCVLLRADLRKRDLPFVAKVAALYEDPETGMSYL